LCWKGQRRHGKRQAAFLDYARHTLELKRNSGGTP
jgi:hypothetical protein